MKKTTPPGLTITNCIFTSKPVNTQVVIALADAAKENAIAISAIAKHMQNGAPLISINQNRD